MSLSIHDLKYHLVRAADAYRVAAKVSSETAVSHRVFGDTKKLSKLRDGSADITLKRLCAAFDWFAANCPEGPEGDALRAILSELSLPHAERDAA
jgi:hypothetical protein